MHINLRKARLCGAAILLLSAATWADAAGLDDANSGLAALNRGDNTAAISLFSKAISSGVLSPMDLELAYVRRAQAYIATGKHDAAISGPRSGADARSKR